MAELARWAACCGPAGGVDPDRHDRPRQRTKPTDEGPSENDVGKQDPIGRMVSTAPGNEPRQEVDRQQSDQQSQPMRDAAATSADHEDLSYCERHDSQNCQCHCLLHVVIPAQPDGPQPRQSVETAGHWINNEWSPGLTGRLCSRHKTARRKLAQARGSGSGPGVVWQVDHSNQHDEKRVPLGKLTIVDEVNVARRRSELLVNACQAFAISGQCWWRPLSGVFRIAAFASTLVAPRRCDGVQPDIAEHMRHEIQGLEYFRKRRVANA